MGNKNQGGDGAAKQEAAGEKYAQEAEQILKLHRQDKVFAPSAFRGVLNAYLLFVAAVTGVGMLASYSHHETTANVFLLISIPLLIIAPIGVLWYLLVTFRKSLSERVAPTKKKWLEKFAESPAGLAFMRFSNNRFVRFVQYASYTLPIVMAIRDWPKNPRSSLAVIVFFLTLIFLVALWDVARWYDRLVATRIKELWDFNNKIVDALTAIGHALNDHKDSILKSFDHLQDQNEFTKTSVLGVLDLFKLMNQPASPPNQIDAAPKETQEQPKQLDAPPLADDEDD